MREGVYMVQIIEEEEETSECDRDCRVNKYERLLKTYQGGTRVGNKSTRGCSLLVAKAGK